MHGQTPASHAPSRACFASRVVPLTLSFLLATACGETPSPSAPVVSPAAGQLPSLAKGNDGGTRGLIAFVSNRDNPAGNEIYTIRPDGTGESRLTYLLQNSGHPALSPDGRYIAFSSLTGGEREIYVMNADGSGLAQLTYSPGEDYAPSWSKGGERIAFVSQRDGNTEIYVMNADGSGNTRITHNTASDRGPVWSADGSRIAFVSDRQNPGSGEWELYTMDPDGTRVTRLTLLHSDIRDVSWHPKGKQLAFGSNHGIYVISVDGSQLMQVVSEGNDGGWGPSWSPDGRRIAFTSSRTGKYELFTMNPDGTAQTQVTSTGAGWNHSPHWGR